MSSTESRFGLQYGWSYGENGWNTGMDNNLKKLGRFGVHLSVKDRDLATPPASPVEGDSYIVAASPTGAWLGKTGQVALWDGSAWVFGVPRKGWICYIEDESKLCVALSASTWSAGVAL